MDVFLDSNIFHNNWKADNALFKLLWRYLRNNEDSLLLSALVVEEVNNLRARELSELRAQYSQVIKKAVKLGFSGIAGDGLSTGDDAYDLQTVLSNTDCLLTKLDYTLIPHADIVERAIKKTKPFNVDEKGYRDTLIWLSFLEHASRQGANQKVAFITNNKHDFFSGGKGEVRLHDDLIKDIKKLGLQCEVVPYDNLHAFIEENVDKVQNSLVKAAFIEDQEWEIIDLTYDYFASLGNETLGAFLGCKVISKKLAPAYSIAFDADDGIEDLKILTVYNSDEDGFVTVECSFYIRSSTIALTVSKDQYKQYSDELESNRYFFNVELSDDYAELSYHVGPVVSLSLNYSYDRKCAKDYSVLNICNKRH